MPITPEKYWGQFSRGALARTQLQQEQLVEYATFTGTDIKAFILPDGDELARTELVRRLGNLNTSISDQSDNQGNNLTASDVSSIIDETVAVQAEGTGNGIRDILPLVGLQSITISTFRNKQQVRALGHVNARGLARGSRTIAGTFIITEFDRDAFWGVLHPPMLDKNVGDSGAVMADQMRPFDIMLLFTHEFGNAGIRHIYGLEVVTNGSVYSVQDYYSENTISYIARDVTPLIPLTPGYMGDFLQGYEGPQLRIKNLISSIRGSTLQSDLDFLRRSRSPFK